MQVDTAAIRAGDELKADVCIVGAGAAGISIARSLIGSGLDVLLLESGGFDADPEVQELYNGRMARTFREGRDTGYVRNSRLRFFGGTTNHWAGWCRPMEADDFEVRPWLPHSGWPITKPDLDPWYDKAASLVEIPPFPHDDSLGHAHTTPLRDDDDHAVQLQTRLFHYSPPTRFGQVYRQELIDASNVRLVLDASVLAVRANPSAETVERLDVRTMDGRRFTVRGRAYILATGGIENARMLLVSKHEQPEGLGNQHDLVGRFFADHPHVRIGDATLASALRLYTKRKGSPKVRGVFVLPQSLRDQEQLLSCSLQLRHFNAPDVPLSDDVDALALETRRAAGRTTRQAAERCVLQIASEMAPNPESRVTLTDELDAFGLQRVELSWQLTDVDARSHRRSAEWLGAVLGRRLLGRVRIHVDPERPLEGTRGGKHHIGTTRMADHPSRGVVDANSRVFGVDNLWIAGSSVFPTTGYCNPTFTIVALALRLASHLRAELSP